jgi:DNA-binding IclR family transcriptional regulator
MYCCGASSASTASVIHTHEEEIRMAYTYEQLSDMTVARLREIAQGIEHDAVKGFSTMHKEKLLPALCLALGIESHKHHTVVGINKGQIKLQIRAMKKKRDEALAKKDTKVYREAIGEIHHLKNKLRHAIK